MAAMAGSCGVMRRLTNQFCRHRGPHICVLRNSTTKNKSNGATEQSFDTKLLDILVCPLSKKPLRYDPASNELISDELGVAYPIVNGIPNLVPSDGRIFGEKKKPPEEPSSES